MMSHLVKWCLVAVIAISNAGVVQGQKSRKTDMLSPLYYSSTDGRSFKKEVDRFVSCARKERFHHPLGKTAARMPRFFVPMRGRFGAGKGPGGDKQYHPAVDFHVGRNTSDIPLYACHDGQVSTFRDAPKYRHYLAITKDVTDDDGEVLGKLVTIFAHIDLDLDEADGLSLNGKTVRKGDIVSRHLYSQTVGGPHLHFEIRYYRPGDTGDETFYGFRFPGRPDSTLTEPSAGPWEYGYWNPDVGYGFADPRNHSAACY